MAGFFPLTNFREVDYVGDVAGGWIVDHAIAVDVTEYIARRWRWKLTNHGFRDRMHAAVPVATEPLARDKVVTIFQIPVDSFVMLAKFAGVLVTEMIFGAAALFIFLPFFFLRTLLRGNGKSSGQAQRHRQ